TMKTRPDVSQPLPFIFGNSANPDSVDLATDITVPTTTQTTLIDTQEENLCQVPAQPQPLSSEPAQMSENQKKDSSPENPCTHRCKNKLTCIHSCANSVYPS